MRSLIVILPLLFLLASCGGGGSSSDLSASANTNQINVTSTDGEFIQKSVIITVNNPPAQGVYIGFAVEKEEFSISLLDLVSISENKVRLDIQFYSSYDLGEGTFTNEVAVVVCSDRACENQIDGSPIIVDTTLISDPTIPDITVFSSTNQLNLTSVDNNDISETIELSLDSSSFDDFHQRVTIQNEDSDIQSAEFNVQSPTTANLDIDIKSSFTLGYGSFANTITVDVCLDEACNYHVQGSPIVINTQLESKPGGDATVTLDDSSLHVVGNVPGNVTPQSQTIPLTLSGIDSSDIFFQVVEVENENVATSLRAFAGNIVVNFRDVNGLPYGRSNASYELSVCLKIEPYNWDDECKYVVEGSPITLDIEYDVEQLLTGVSFIQPDARYELEHDVVDVSYSSQLNSIAIASSSPHNAVYVYDLDNIDTPDVFDLSERPSSISFANAGNSNKIFVSSESQITYIEYNVSSPLMSPLEVLSIPVDEDAFFSLDIGDVIATDTEVYLVNTFDGFTELYIYDLLTGIMTNSGVYTSFDDLLIKAHPDLESIYSLSIGLSPSVLTKLNLEDMTQSVLYDLPYQDEICDNLWLSNDGSEIYTACGNVFSTPDQISDDMVYLGQLNPATEYYGWNNYRLDSVSESNSLDELATIESASIMDCDDESFSTQCLRMVSFFNKSARSRHSSFAFDSVSIDGTDFIEKPKHIFYNSAGTSAFAISEALGASPSRSYIVELQR